MRLLALVGAAVMVFVLGLGSSAAAHEIRPVFLDIREVTPGRYDVTWKRPVFNGHPLPVTPRFAAGCRAGEEAPSQPNGSFVVSRLSLACTNGLAGQSISFDGLSGTMVDGLVRVKFVSGEMAMGIVRPDDPVFRTPARSGPLKVFAAYLRLGVEHILLGFDHLLFVLALVLFVRQWRRLLLTATAFTLAHSITLSLAALGVIRVPVPPVEALIALSILLLAAELLRAERDPGRAGGMRPAGLAFAFGLLHGLGFASALANIGLPQHEITLSLLAFNLGVELGQVAFIVALLGAGVLAARVNARAQQLALRAAAYGIGSLGAFWTIERIAGF